MSADGLCEIYGHEWGEERKCRRCGDPRPRVPRRTEAEHEARMASTMAKYRRGELVSRDEMVERVLARDEFRRSG